VNPIRDPLHVGDKKPGVAGARRRLGVGFQFCPTGEPLLPGDDKLSIVQGQFLAHCCVISVGPAEVLAAQAGKCVGASRANCAQQFASLFFLLFEIQDCLLRMPGPHDRRKRVIND
jgi:hypothetical protein